MSAVTAGHALEFFTEGQILHQLFSYDENNAFEIETRGGEVSSSVVFEHPGVVHFYCSLHPAEGGRIFVAPEPHFTQALPDGRFQIANVPAGSYRLKTWGPRTAPTERTIVVPLDRSDTLSITLEPTAGASR